MPITKSVKKTLRQSLKRRAKNLRKKRITKAAKRQLKLLISENKIKEAETLLPRIYKALDKAAKTEVIKKNTASRKKSRIVKLLNKSFKTK